MKMREGRRRAVVYEAPAETARTEMRARLGEAGEETLETEVAEQVEMVARVGFAPIVRVDAATREVELCATSEALDSHGTVFDYAASKDVFTRWIGNVREMHERRAVGKRVAVRCDDELRRVYVRIRISRGAQDTWEKVQDGTLRGASIGASNVIWERQRRQVGPRERWLNVATRYDLVELSLVDNPSNPDALGLTFVRDAVPDTALLDVVDEGAPDAQTSGRVQPARADAEGAERRTEVAAQPAEEARRPETRQEQSQPSTATARDSRSAADVRATEEALHTRLHSAAAAILQGCGCPLCQGALAMLDDSAIGAEGAERAVDGRPGLREAAIARVIATSQQASMARMDCVNEGLGELKALVRVAMERMAATLGGLDGRVGQLEEQPLPGGPVARVVEKSHALASRREESGSAPNRAEQYRALEALAGRLRDPQSQVAVAAELIRLQQEG